MDIIKRYKDNNGNTAGYEVVDNGIYKNISLETALQLRNRIRNASVVKVGNNEEFRANKGKHIETVVNLNAIKVSRKKLPTLRNKNTVSNNNEEFNGKQYINVCREIRRYALSNKLEIDTRPHKSNAGLNTNLFKLIEACDIGLREFICGYLSVLQPYSLSKFQESNQKNVDKDNIWLCDINYGISMVIKINKSDKQRPVVVSFHESNKGNKYRHGCGNKISGKCAVLADYQNKNTLGYNVSFVVQRGFIRYTIETSVEHVINGVAMVDYGRIKYKLDSLINILFDRIRDGYLSKYNDGIPVIIDDKQSNKLSFMSLGFATVNNICLMLDLYSQYTDRESRSAIVEMSTTIIEEIPDYKAKEIRIALRERYGGSNNKLYKIIDNML